MSSKLNLIWAEIDPTPSVVSRLACRADLIIPFLAVFLHSTSYNYKGIVLWIVERTPVQSRRRRPRAGHPSGQNLNLVFRPPAISLELEIGKVEFKEEKAKDWPSWSPES